ncbi:MAG: radical SAM protein [Sulfurospirillaceae bacterium]|nr:radical SAM protein [Sulfurospirillaceae bacterium]
MKEEYNILLIAPRYGVYGLYYSFPIGLACISSSLKYNGHKVKCLNLNHYENEDEILDTIMAENNIKIVATGGLSAHYNGIKKLREKFKKYDNLVFILGGGIISSEPELMFNSLDIDYGVLNEGEETIVELANHILHNADSRIEDIKGIIYRKNTFATLTEARNNIENLDNLPFPDYDGFEIAKYLDMQKPNDEFTLSIYDNPRMIPIMTTRSCPFSCTFCYHPLGKKYRISSLDYFFKWLDYLVSKYDINILMLLDELFSVNKPRMLEFAKRIKPYKLKWSAAMRVTDVDNETLEVLKDAGLYFIGYGLESASNTILTNMKKKIKISDIENALFLTRKHNIGIQGNFIFGDPAETEETYNETLSWWKKNIEYQVMLSSISAYPGTPIYLEALANGKIRDRLQFIQDGCPQINLTKMTDESYINMRQNIINSIFEYKIYPEVLKSEIIGFDKYRGNLYSILLICPHCNKKNHYLNMHKVESFVTKVCCKYCIQKFDVNSDKMFCDYEFEDTYFLNANRALEVAKENNTIKLKGKELIQTCYYEGNVLEGAPFNCVNVPYSNFKKFFITNKQYRIPTKIEFGLASFVKDRRTAEIEFFNMRIELSNERITIE